MIALDVDPNLVVSGWTPLFLTLGLAGVVVLLAFSMTRQMRKVRSDLPRRHPGEPEPGEPAEPAAREDGENLERAKDAAGQAEAQPAAAAPVQPSSADSAR